MKASWIIARKELVSFFDALTAYIMLVAFIGFSGFFTWLFGTDIFLRNQADLKVFFSIAYWTLFFFIPAITMRMFAEENRTGTIEVLLTKPVTEWQVVTGKFLACLLLVCVALALTLPYYLTVWRLGNIDHGATLTGYFGLLLMSSVYISIGLYTSSMTSNQIVAFLAALFAGLMFNIIFEVLASNFTGAPGMILHYLSLSSHYESITRGVIDSKDLIYFLSLMLLFLMATEMTLTKRKLAQ
jgi:ABC-2 type transport system permease protein